MKKKPNSLARALPALLLCLLCLVPTAYADMGPKPEVTITVVNAPEGTLYLDLLTEETPTEHPYSNLDNYDPAILESLRSLEGDGWVLAYSTGVSGPPVFGDLRPREDGTWHFSYHGVPVAFRVAAATADEARAVEEIYTRPFVCHIVYDWEANTVQEATPPLLRFLARLAATLIPTLVIEGILFWLFGFRERRSWLVFLLINTITQVGLHLAMGSMLAKSGWHFLNYSLTLLIPELVIWCAEAAVYALLLKEHPRGRRIGYAFSANVASFILGYFPLHLLYGFLKSL